MQGYVVIHRNAKLTCTDGNSNTISYQQTDNDSACKRICDVDESCKFFFLNTHGYCAIYKSCKVKRDAYRPGTTYKKAHQNGKCNVVTFHKLF